MLEILETFCAPFHVAATETVKRRVLAEAVRHATPYLLAYAESKRQPIPHERKNDGQP